MFDQRDNTKQLILLNYLTSKGTYDFLPLDKLSELVTELRSIEGLDEGVKLDYIQNKIDQGIELDEEEFQVLLTTLSLHGTDKFFDEKFGLVRVQ